MRVHETFELFESSTRDRGDRERGLLLSVKVLGWRSANGREYLPEGVSASLYEGARVHCDHKGDARKRTVADVIAVLEGAHKRAAGIFAERLRLLDPEGALERR